MALLGKERKSEGLTALGAGLGESLIPAFFLLLFNYNYNPWCKLSYTIHLKCSLSNVFGPF